MTIQSITVDLINQIYFVASGIGSLSQKLVFGVCDWGLHLRPMEGRWMFGVSRIEAGDGVWKLGRIVKD